MPSASAANDGFSCTTPLAFGMQRGRLQAESTLVRLVAVGLLMLGLFGGCGGDDGFELTSVITVFGDQTVSESVEGVVVFVNLGSRDVVGELRLWLLTGDGDVVDEGAQDVIVPPGPQPYVTAFVGLFAQEPGEYTVRGEAFGFSFRSKPFFLTD